MQRYLLEFTLNTKLELEETIKNSLIEFGENLEVIPLDAVDEKIREYRIRINTGDPTLVFDACAQFGRLKSVRIDHYYTQP